MTKWLLGTALVGALLGGCAPDVIDHPAYPMMSDTAFPDQYVRLERGVWAGPAPADTVIPKDDGSVGQMQ